MPPEEQNQENDPQPDPAVQSNTSPDKGEATAAISPAEMAAAIKAELLADDSFKTPAGVSKEEFDQALAAQREEIANRIVGKKEQKGLDPLARELLTNPEQTLGALVDILDERRRSDEEDRRAALNAENAVGVKLQSERPDITGSADNAKLVGRLYNLTDPSKSPQERMDEAVKDYDKIYESAGSGTSKERIAAAMPVDSASSSKDGKTKDQFVSDEDAFKSDLDERRTRRELIRKVA